MPSTRTEVAVVMQQLKFVLFACNPQSLLKTTESWLVSFGYQLTSIELIRWSEKAGELRVKLTNGTENCLLYEITDYIYNEVIT